MVKTHPGGVVLHRASLDLTVTVEADEPVGKTNSVLGVHQLGSAARALDKVHFFSV